MKISGAKAWAEHIADRKFKLYLCDPAEVKIQVQGKPRAKIFLEAETPVIDWDFDKPRLGALMSPMTIPDNQVDVPLDRNFKALDGIVEAGCDMMSISPLCSWTGLNTGDVFEKDSSGKFDLSKISTKFKYIMRCFYWRASRFGVSVHTYPYEMISIKDYSRKMWGWHPFNAERNNNGIGWISPSNYRYPRYGVHLVYQEGNPPQAKEWVTKYLNAIRDLIPIKEHHPIVPFLEGTSKRVDINILTDAKYPHCGTNLSYLWGSDKTPVETVKTDGAWRELFQYLDFFVQHHSDAGDTEQLRDYAKPIADHYGVKVMLSSDGTGLGSYARRPEGNRPNAHDHALMWAEGKAVLGESFAGLEVKLLADENWIELLKQIKSQL